MTLRIISYKDAQGNFVSSSDIWNKEKLEELFERLNPNRSLRLNREKSCYTTSNKY
ncbi:hypothetical protein [Streptococcus sp. DD10]|uniref:hypothetical protein n=1 Tax=Streptococcus sp. DD10 TaxID=1777878 RepID=UPI000A517B2C|nr:hypothetical protein [Streptococcus sp. DD10]